MLVRLTYCIFILFFESWWHFQALIHGSARLFTKGSLLADILASFSFLWIRPKNEKEAKKWRSKKTLLFVGWGGQHKLVLCFSSINTMTMRFKRLKRQRGTVWSRAGVGLKSAGSGRACALHCGLGSGSCFTLRARAFAGLACPGGRAWGYVVKARARARSAGLGLGPLRP
jgi:hypothetical protein